MLLEICTPTLESVQAAVAGGADRIELCENLDKGGTTPPAVLIKKVTSKFDINIQVLIRPRGGNFVYNAIEVQQMLRDIELVKQFRAAGIVVGALKKDKNLDTAALTRLKHAAAGMQISFHKAIDEVTKPEKAIEQLIGLGFTRILSSGGQPMALAGLDRLISWQEKYGDLIEIMPGGSIRPENVASFKGNGFAAIHSAATAKGEHHSNENTVRQLLQAICD